MEITPSLTLTRTLVHILSRQGKGGGEKWSNAPCRPTTTTLGPNENSQAGFGESDDLFRTEDRCKMPTGVTKPHITPSQLSLSNMHRHRRYECSTPGASPCQSIHSTFWFTAIYWVLGQGRQCLCNKTLLEMDSLDDYGCGTGGFRVNARVYSTLNERKSDPIDTYMVSR